MHLFDIFVVRQDCITSLEAVKNHPKVKRVTLLPRDWLFYEFHDALLQDPDYLVEGVWEKKMRDHPDVRAARIQMLKEERNLLRPWYQLTNKMGDGDHSALSEVGQYRIHTLRPFRVIDFEPTVGWGASKFFSVVLQAASDSQNNLSTLVRELESASDGRFKLRGGLSPAEDGFRFDAECQDYSGHWLVSLWALLCDRKLKMGVSRMVATCGDEPLLAEKK